MSFLPAPRRFWPGEVPTFSLGETVGGKSSARIAEEENIRIEKVIKRNIYGS